MQHNEWIFLSPILNSADITLLINKLNAVLKVLDQETFQLIKQMEWVAVPAESGDHLSMTDREHLLKVALNSENYQIMAIALENIKDFPVAFQFSVSTESIEEFNRKCGHFSFALFAGAPDWFILCTKLDYIVISGKLDFVEAFLGSKLDEGFSRFDEFVDNCTYESENWRKRLSRVLGQLKYEYLTAEPGALIDLF